jgi:hypothetical protein
MTYDLHTIIRDTRILLDLDSRERPLIPHSGGRPHIDSMIRAMLLPAVRTVIQHADIHLLGPGEPIRATLAWPEGRPGVGMAILPLPDDCLRLLAVKLTDWKRPARIQRETDAEYAWQSSTFTGIRGNPDRPVAVVCQRPTGEVAELYSSNSRDGVGVDMAQYAPMPQLHADNTIRLHEAIYHTVINQMAQMVGDILENN